MLFWGSFYVCPYRRTVLLCSDGQHCNYIFSYQHPGNISVELMLEKALLLVLPEFTITAEDGRDYKLHECCFDMSAYCQLNDEFIFQQILNCGMIIKNFTAQKNHDAKDRWTKARMLLQQVQCGKFWPHVGHAKFNNPAEFVVRKYITLCRLAKL